MRNGMVLRGGCWGFVIEDLDSSPIDQFLLLSRGASDAKERKGNHAWTVCWFAHRIGVPSLSGILSSNNETSILHPIKFK